MEKRNKSQRNASVRVNRIQWLIHLREGEKRTWHECPDEGWDHSSRKGDLKKEILKISSET